MEIKKSEDNKKKRGNCVLTQTMGGLLLSPSCPETLAIRAGLAGISTGCTTTAA